MVSVCKRVVCIVKYSLSDYMMKSKQVPFYLFLFIGVTVTNPARKLHSDRRYCGYQHTDDYVRLSNNISLDEFPWMALLLYGEDLSVRCCGSLISNRYVLTGANCINTGRKNLTMVRLGDYNVKTESDCVDHEQDGKECSDSVQQFHIEEIVVHPNFNIDTDDNDIALLRLSKTVFFSDFIRPICLPKKNAPDLKSGEQLSVSGWGTLQFGGVNTALKKRVMVNLISKDECAEVYKDIAPITNDHLCATENDSITCNGDGGGPLMYSVKNQWEQVGIMSFGVYCGAYYPTVYTKVSNYLQWIEETLHV